FPVVPQYQIDLGVQHSNLGLLLMGTGKLPEAATAFREAGRILTPVVADPSAVPEARQVLAGSHMNLGFVLYRQNNTECEAEFLAALDIFQPLLAEFPNNPDYQRQLAATYNHLGNFHPDAQRPAEALADVRESLTRYEPLAERFPLVPNYRSELGGTLNNLAMVRLNQGELAEAQQFLERAVGQQRAALQVNPRNPVYRE